MRNWVYNVVGFYKMQMTSTKDDATIASNLTELGPRSYKRVQSIFTEKCGYRRVYLLTTVTEEAKMTSTMLYASLTRKGYCNA